VSLKGSSTRGSGNSQFKFGRYQAHFRSQIFEFHLILVEREDNVGMVQPGIYVAECKVRRRAEVFDFACLCKHACQMLDLVVNAMGSPGKDAGRKRVRIDDARLGQFGVLEDDIH
jgi:hypothetical protein